MDLVQYTYLAVSVAATLFSLLLIGLLVTLPFVLKRIYAVIDRFDSVGKVGLEATLNLKHFVERTTGLVEAFTSFQGAKEVVSHISDAINKVKHKKES